MSILQQRPQGAQVARITRTEPSRWVAAVRFTRGRTTWNETVAFQRVIVGNLSVVTVTDADYPDDRRERLCVAKGADMPSLIRRFLLTGRW